MNTDLKDRIIQTSIRLFSQNGLKNINTDLIAQEAGISKRTLYEIFPSKEQLIKEVIMHLTNSILLEVQKMNNVIDEENENNFEIVFQHSIKVMNELKNNFTKQVISDLKRFYPEIWEEIHTFFMLKMKEGFFLKIFHYGQDKGYIRKDINIDLVYFIHITILENVVTPEIISELPMSTNDVMKSIFDIFLRGILTEKYRKDQLIET